MRLQKVIPFISNGGAGQEDKPASENINFEELKRLQLLDEYQITDEQSPKEFDAIARLASYVCQTPIALITFIDQDTQWIKASVGVDIDKTPRKDSFCQYTIQSDAVLEVPDTLDDHRFCWNQYVTDEPKLRFYAGAPLIASGGYRLGSLCVLDYKPRILEENQKEALQILAAQVVSHLEIKRKNKELKRVLARYRQFHDLFNSSNELHCIISKEGEIRYVNDSVITRLGYTPEEVLGRNIWEFCEEGSRDKVMPAVEAALLAGETRLEIETRVVTKSNEIRCFSWCYVIHDEYRLISGRDVTAEKEAKEELEQLSLVASKIDSGVVISDKSGNVIWINDAFTKITGYILEDISGRRLGDVIKGERTDEKILETARNYTDNKRSFTIDLLSYHKSGREIWLSIMSSVIVNGAGETEREIEILTDISERKKTELEFETLSMAVRKSSAGVLIRDGNGEAIWINDSFEKMLGYSLDELRGQPLVQLVSGERTDPDLLKMALKASANKEPYEMEIIFYKKDKTPAWFYISNNPVINEEGNMQRQVALIMDISLRKQQEEQLRLLSLVASKTGNGVIINDKEGRVNWVNESFEQITGYELKDLKGKFTGDILKGKNTNFDELQRVRKLSRAGKSYHTDLLNYRRDGTPVWMSVHNTPVFNEKGEVEQEVEIVNDVSSRKLAEQELIKAREEALQLSKAKETFLSVMSHEIRTPLNAVIGLTHVLLEDDPNPSQLENLNILKFSAENLLSLLNDILDFTKIETGKLQLESVDLNLGELVSSTISSMQFKAGEKGNTLYSEVDPEIPDFVKGDHTRLYQILINLIGNSIKFTSGGTIKLKLSLVDSTEESLKVRFEVSDTGIGIPEEKLDYIFEAYTQAEADTSRKYGGTGLGLAITKKLLHLHHSEIYVQSTVGKGSDFIFTIDFKTSGLEEKKMIVTDQPEHIEAFILVVDDNEINRFLAKKVLEKGGMAVDFACTGEEAVEKVAEAEYDLVFMDIHMPGMDGFEAALKIRELENGKYKNLPIIALTASILNHESLGAEINGMNDFVFKPFVPEELYSKIRTYVNKRKV